MITHLLYEWVSKDELYDRGIIWDAFCKIDWCEDKVKEKIFIRDFLNNQI